MPGAFSGVWEWYVSQDRPGADAKFDDEDYPAYSMGRAAELLEVTQPFLRSLEQAGLIRPHRSEGGHRRYSRRQLRRAERARELITQGTPVAAACRIITLEDQLADHTDPPGSAGPETQK